jgi:hypothetical protein
LEEDVRLPSITGLTDGLFTVLGVEKASLLEQI